MIYANLAIAVVWVCVAVVAIAAVLLKPRSRVQATPVDALVIGQNYLRVWATPRRVHIRTRQEFDFLFDRRAARQLGEWLVALPEVADGT
jgi:hypothetical protein